MSGADRTRRATRLRVRACVPLKIFQVQCILAGRLGALTSRQDATIMHVSLDQCRQDRSYFLVLEALGSGEETIQARSLEVEPT